MIKDKAISKDMAKVKKMLELIPADRKPVAEKLIKELDFISRTLDNLRDTVDTMGTVELFEQGKQKFTRESPALKSYNTTIQRYSLLYKQLTDMLPKAVPDNTGNALYEFINKG